MRELNGDLNLYERRGDYKKAFEALTTSRDIEMEHTKVTIGTTKELMLKNQLKRKRLSAGGLQRFCNRTSL